ncbi:hypothetical protein [Haliea sp. E17]|uniref:hypothetical protein n=1 Tax=Haliea sp. E17 TaxID=3401576 RepID=UPI003AB0E51B
MASGFPSRSRLVFGIYLLALIIALELVLHHYQLPAWPVFLVMIFFFETHMNPGRAPHLLLGGLAGICCFVLTVYFVDLAGTALGAWPAKLLFVCLVVYAIVALGEVWPMLFNNYAFMFYLVSGLAARDTALAPAPLVWMGLVIGGGAIVIAAVLLIGQLMSKSAAKTKATGQ